MSRQIKIGIFIILVTISISAIFYGYQIVFTPNILVEGKNSQKIIIPTGADFQQVLDTLTQRNIVHDPISFAFVSKLMKYQQLVKPGLYTLHPDMSNREAVGLLRSGAQTPVNITFTYARNYRQLAQSICKNLEMPASHLEAMLTSAEVAERYGFDTTTFLCMFLPNTYEVYYTSDADQILNKLKKAYAEFWTPDRLRKADSLGLSAIEVCILSSIVNAETKKVDEMPKVAGVYLNRLNNNWLLQADPTLIYATGDFQARRVTLAHKAIDSPYNTYKYTGLPPGPINLPSQKVLNAVLKAQKHPYMFFCARPDFSGYHDFAINYTEHLKNARQYHNALNQRNIYK